MADAPRVKTLHFTNSWHASAGGIGTFYRALFETANRERHRMRLVVPGETSRIEEVGEFGLVYHVASPRAPFCPGYRMLYPHRFLFPKTAVQRILNDEQPDLIEVSEKYSAPYLAGLLRTRRLPGVSHRPAVVGLSHERMDENVAAYLTDHPRARQFCRWYMKWIYFPMFDHHITVSEHTAHELIEASHGHKVRRGIWVLPMGVDCQLFTPARRSAGCRRKLLQRMGGNWGTGKPDTKVLLYVGRLAPEKNLPLLIATMRCLRDGPWRLAIAGEGIQLESMRAECAALNLTNIDFLGHIGDRNILADYYANADVFLHPNPCEPFGIAPLEAMASGLPLVAPDAGGIKTYASEANAWLSQPTGEAFAGSIRAILADPESERLKIAAARHTAEAFDWPNVTSRYLCLYRELDAITRGAEPASTLAPRTYSTPGDVFGRELIEL